MQFVTDFRDLNKWVQRNPYLIPPIRDTLNKLDNFTYAIAIDISMGYWYIILDPTSQLKCIITKPWGRYAYQCLPMGLCISADIFQERIARLTEALEFVKVYIDNLLCITKGSFDDYLQKLEQLLHVLNDTGLKVKASKYKWCVDEVEYLGYMLT